MHMEQWSCHGRRLETCGWLGDDIGQQGDGQYLSGGMCVSAIVVMRMRVHHHHAFDHMHVRESRGADPERQEKHQHEYENQLMSRTHMH